MEVGSKGKTVKNVKKTIVLACLLSFGFSGSGFAGEQQSSLKRLCRKVRGWALVFGGLGFIFYHGNGVGAYGLKLLTSSEEDEENGSASPLLSVSRLLIGIYYFATGVEGIHDIYISDSSRKTKKKTEDSLKSCAQQKGK